MNYKIDKASFYLFLERMLNTVYDEANFKLHIESRDLNSSIIGTEYKYSIIDNNENKMFESSIGRVYKVKTLEGYANRNYKINDNFTLGEEINKLLSSSVYKYKVLEIVPLLLETYFEETKVKGEVNFLDNDEINYLCNAAKKYNEDQTLTKVKTLNKIK